MQPAAICKERAKHQVRFDYEYGNQHTRVPLDQGLNQLLICPHLGAGIPAARSAWWGIRPVGETLEWCTLAARLK
jgi:hypothetical protein